MSSAFVVKDLIVVVADADAEKAIETLLRRHRAFGIRHISFDIRRHVQRDPGCRTATHSFLRPEIDRYQYAMVVFDWEGAGAEDKSPEEIESFVETSLSESGWFDRCAVVVIKPELEMWVWSDSPHLSTALGWKNKQPSVHEWIKANTAFWPPNTNKPSRPKEALEASLRVVRKSSSPSLFETLAERVSVERCVDRAFGKFKKILKQWFGEPDRGAAGFRVCEEPAHYAAKVALEHLNRSTSL